MTVTVQATYVATLVDEWVRNGITDAVIAPGSRSTPLTLALAADGRLRTHVFLDERSAGFFAVGLGLATGRPAVVVTTSGTAAVELHPAVVEASQARVPLLVCTADRPPELHHVHAPQTVEQGRLYGDVVRWFVEPGTADGFPGDHWRSLASRMVVEALAGAGGPGPVHANLAFRDPLVGDAGELPAGRADGAPWHAAPTFPGSGGLPRRTAAAVSSRTGRVVVVAGAGAPPDVAGAGVPVFADPRSGLRGTEHAVAAFDSILRCDGVPAPDLVVRVGQPPASKVLSQWLAALPESTDHVIVDPHGGWPDPERRAATRLDVFPTIEGDLDERWLAWWRAADDAAQRAIDAVLAAQTTTTEPGVIRSLTRNLPATTTFFVSSSMPIRDIEWFGDRNSRHRVVSNRGANGIDGVVSTALGVAAADPSTPVVAVVGDLAFLYDASALLWADRRPVDLTIVVLGNDGGGIFSFLPQRSHLAAEEFERFFGTPHGLEVSALAAAYGVPAVDEVGTGSGVRLVVVRSDRNRNVEVHDELNAGVAAAISSASLSL